VTLIVSPAGPTVRAGGAFTVSVTLTVCGLPAMARPPSTAASETEPLYFPAARAAEVTFTVKVVLPPLMVAGAGVTVNQLCVAVGVIVTFPVHAPMIPMVKCWLAGFVPASALKFSWADEGASSVHGGCSVSVTAIVCGLPTACCVTLSTALIVTWPV